MPSPRTRLDPAALTLSLAVAAGLYLAFVALFSTSFADFDLWGYLAFGRLVLDDGSFPYRDPFSYTPTRATWIYHEWLTGVVFRFIDARAGAAGLQLLRYVAALLTLYAIYLVARRRGAGAVAAAASLPVVMLLLSFGYVPVRAQVFTYLFFALTLLVLEEARRSRRWRILAWLVPIQILWCNLHGGYVSGLALVFLFALGEALSGKPARALSISAAAATLVTVLNPYGPEYWRYTIDAIRMPRPEIDEWLWLGEALRRGAQTPALLSFLIAAAPFTFLLLARRRRDLTDLLVAAAVLCMGVRHIRHTTFFALVLGAQLPPILSEMWRRWEEEGGLRRPPWLAHSLAVIVVLSFHLALKPPGPTALSPTFALATPSPFYPPGALRWIRDHHLHGNILPHFDWGEIVIWLFYPHCRVAMDGRYETVYEAGVAREYFDFLMGRDGWRTFLDKYPHDLVLLKANTRTHELMLHEPRWRVAYADAASVVFVRRADGEGERRRQAEPRS